MLDLLADLNREEEVTLILVTHNPLVAKKAARTITMVDGRIVDQGLSASQATEDG